MARFVKRQKHGHSLTTAT